VGLIFYFPEFGSSFLGSSVLKNVTAYKSDCICNILGNVAS